MRVADFLSHLHGVRHSSRGHLALCPSHADTNQSLSIREGEKGILVKCWAGCELSAIAHAVGLKISDLFFDAGLPRGQRPAPKTAHVNRRSLAFRFELAALDHRLRAEAILREAANVMVSGLTDDALGRLIDVVASAYHDLERAELFESVSDSLRLKDFYSHRGAHHAA